MTIDPSMPSAAHTRMSGRWELPRSLMGGTATMRMLAYKFLPRHPAESGRHWHARLQRSVLRNFFRRTVLSLTGKVFAKPLVLGDDVPQRLRDLMEDVDLMGRNLHVFAREVFADALIHGLSHILVDYPRIESGGTLADEQALGARPYAVHIRAEQLIGWRVEDEGGRPRLTQIRLRESVTEPDGAFGERQVDQVRVLEPGAWTLWRQDEDGDWMVVESGQTSLDVIPLVTIYTHRCGVMEAEPPLEDLAWLNLEHWQIRSDQRNALNVTSFPILAAAGWNKDDGQVEFGPNKFLTTADPQGKFYYVESGGAHLAAGRAELEALEEAMRLFGLQFELASAPTATGRILDAAEGSAPLQDWALGLADAIEQMLMYFARWEGLTDGGSVTLGGDVVPSDSRELEVLIKARATGDISKEAFLAELKRRGVLGDG